MLTLTTKVKNFLKQHQTEIEQSKFESVLADARFWERPRNGQVDDRAVLRYALATIGYKPEFLSIWENAVEIQKSIENTMSTVTPHNPVVITLFLTNDIFSNSITAESNMNNNRGIVKLTADNGIFDKKEITKFKRSIKNAYDSWVRLLDGIL